MLSTILIACIVAVVSLAVGFFVGIAFGAGVWKAAYSKSDCETGRMVAGLKDWQGEADDKLARILAHAREISLEVCGSWGPADDDGG